LESFVQWCDDELPAFNSKKSKNHCSACTLLRAVRSGHDDLDPKLRATGSFAVVCRHNIPLTEYTMVMRTRGEGLFYAHCVIRKNMHRSGYAPLEDVFGAVPDVKDPRFEFLFTDMPCMLEPYLRNRDSDAYEYIKDRLGLGSLHKYAHKCRLFNDMMFKSFAGDTAGENGEHWFGLLKHHKDRLKSQGFNSYVTLLNTAQDFRLQCQNARILNVLFNNRRRSNKKFLATLGEFRKMIENNADIRNHLIRKVVTISSSAPSADSSATSCDVYFTSMLKKIRHSVDVSRKSKKKKKTMNEFTLCVVMTQFLDTFNWDPEQKDADLKTEAREWLGELYRDRNRIIGDNANDDASTTSLKSIIAETSNICKHISSGRLQPFSREIVNSYTTILNSIRDMYERFSAIHLAATFELETINRAHRRRFSIFLDSSKESVQRLKKRTDKMKQDIKMSERRMQLMEVFFSDIGILKDKEITIDLDDASDSETFDVKASRAEICKLVESYFRLCRCMEESYIMALEVQSIITQVTESKKSLDSIRKDVKRSINKCSSIKDRRRYEGELRLVSSRYTFYGNLLTSATNFFKSLLAKDYFISDQRKLCAEATARVESEVVSILRGTESKRTNPNVPLNSNILASNTSPIGPLGSSTKQKEEDDTDDESDMRAEEDQEDTGHMSSSSTSSIDDDDGSDFMSDDDEAIRNMSSSSTSSVLVVNTKVSSKVNDAVTPLTDHVNVNITGGTSRLVNPELDRCGGLYFVKQIQTKQFDDTYKQIKAMSKKLYKKQNWQVKRTKFLQCTGGVWLNDEVLNQYRKALRHIANGRVLLYNTHFFDFLRQWHPETSRYRGYKYESVVGHTSNKVWNASKLVGTDIFHLDALFIPINESNGHWVCTIVFPQSCRIELHDSFGSPDTTHLNTTFKYIQDEWNRKRNGINHNWNDWQLISVQDSPRQTDGHSCGVHVCARALCLIHNQNLDFDNDIMDQFRRHIFLTIANGRLTPDPQWNRFYES
jgi:hypothetical protein